jgi:translation initiation factor IF-3
MSKQAFGRSKSLYKGRGPQTRVNDRIRVPEVRLIGPDGSQIGIVSSRDALAKAKQLGLDLVEISPSARPPVCRILDYGKYKYEQSKKQKDNKTTTTKLKELKFRLNIDQHDYETKLRRAEAFLGKGNKVKISLMFRGREMEHKDIGFEVIKRAIADLEGMGSVDSEPKLVGRNITLTLSPLAANKRKYKFLKSDAEADTVNEEDDSADEE